MTEDLDNGFPSSPFSAPKGTLPFTGIATFAGYPFWKKEQRSDAVIMGVPYDEGTTYRSGTRLGPRSIRNASMFYAYEGAKDRFFDADRNQWILSGKTIADAGDVNIEPLSRERNWRLVTRYGETILDAHAIPAVLGGDHSITYPVVKAFEKKRIHYVHLDTHADCDRIFESDYTHGSPVARIFEENLARSLTLIGIRGLTNSGRDLAWIQKQGARVITACQLHRHLRDHQALSFEEGSYYISLDIDFFDPSAAPGTGTPEPGGLFFPDFSDLVHNIAEKGKIVGFDVVEVNPLLEGHHAITSHLAARCVLELLSAALD
ncbi:MAG: hypothetical protein AMJ79_11515 [Phycisphaerae bacterium SM23_30]|nr:MAG: hypothetical protein AMJ79_11515 [Phycisphaerae bacterium SM23_30]